jgi:hypothetical protein
VDVCQGQEILEESSFGSRGSYRAVALIIIIIIIIISCHRFSFFPGTSSLEPVVNPTTQASSLSLQYFPLMMCEFPSMVVFCRESIESCPGIVSRHFCKFLLTIPVALMFTGMTKHFMFHIL